MKKIAIAMVQEHVDVFGPTNRLGIWFQGCPHRCLGCESVNFQIQTNFINLELFLQNLRSQIKTKGFNRIIISGGEPFYQAKALLEILKDIRLLYKELNVLYSDILVYTGYTYKEIKKMPLGKEILALIDVLVDGRYIQEKDDGKSLRGSSNQKIIFLNKSLKKQYMPYINCQRKYSINWNDALGFVYIGLHPKINL